MFAADQDPKKGTFTDPGYVEALERFKELAGYMNSDMTAVGHEVARNAWIAGDAPPIMYLQSAEVGYLKDVTFDYGTFNFPSVAGGKGGRGRAHRRARGLRDLEEHQAPGRGEEVPRVPAQQAERHRLCREGGGS